MSRWSGTKFGLKIADGEKKTAEQLFAVLGVSTEGTDLYEEIGKLSTLYSPTMEGDVEGDLLGLMEELDRYFSDYPEQFEEYQDDEDEEDNTEKSSTKNLDDLFLIIKKLFRKPWMYLVHEDGNDTSDSFYRCEVIYSPESEKTELNCYYSYGEGINIGGSDPKEDGTETVQGKVSSDLPDSALIISMYEEAVGGGFDELAQILKKQFGLKDSQGQKRSIADEAFEIEDGVLISFEPKRTVKDVVIPEGVIVVDSYAFSGNEDMKSVIIPEGVVSIEDGAFQECGSLSSVSFPESLKKIGEKVFSKCPDLSDISFSEGLTEIGEGSFEDCDGLTEVIIPDSVKEIGAQAFRYCRNLSKIKLPDGVTVIRKGLFEYCENLNNIILPGSVTEIEDGAFHQTALAKIIVPEKVDVISAQMFGSCQNLVSLEIPDHVHTIKWGAFACCDNLKEVFIPESVREIDEKVFAGCDNLTVSVVAGSYAEQYCKGYGLKYVCR